MNEVELEAGKKRVEAFIMELAKALKESSDISLLWWSADSLRPDSDESPGEATVPLRIYSGNRWRSIGFARSDMDASLNDPGALRKYEKEIADILAEI